MAKRNLWNCELCRQFIPHQHLERLQQINSNQKPKKIFIDSMWDWNCIDIKEEWLIPILEKMEECDQHIFQILSKVPERYGRFNYPSNVWLGASINVNADLFRIEDLVSLKSPNLKFVSVEPIHEKIESGFSNVDWIIVGAETGNRREKIVPEKEWIEQIIGNARLKGIPLFLKNNLNWKEKIQEFPSPHKYKKLSEW